MRALAVLFFGVFLGIFLAFWISVRMIERYLGRFLAQDEPEKYIRSLSGRVPGAELLESLIDKCASQRTRENTAQIFDKQTELTALQSQINPHFLYNTLECIRGQALLDDNFEIAKMTEALSSFFRYSISRKGNFVTLRDELDNINNYMLIQQYRFNNRFTLDIVIDEVDKIAYDYLVPRLIIQPVVENAIFHGLEEKMGGGIVTIEIILTDSSLMIIVSDNGKGIEKNQLNMLNERIHSGGLQIDSQADGQTHTGIALPNINKRIQLLFGNRYGVNVYSTLGQGTDVEIIVPADYMRKEGWKNEEGASENT